MKNEATIKIDSKFANKLKRGYPLLTKEMIGNTSLDEGSIVKLVDERNFFLAKGYLGEQNKGAGWVLTYNENETIDCAFFEEKIKSAIIRRDRYYKDSSTTAFRIFNGEGDGIGGLTIDYYDGYYLFQWYSIGIYSFKDVILQSFENVCDFKGIYQKKRFDQQGQYIEDDDFVKGTKAQFPLIVKENGVNIAVYLNDGAMTGVFLDQKDVRNTLKNRYAHGKTVLNTFSYTGVFSIFAALGGATKTTSVDLAKRSLSKTIEQFNVNNIDYTAHDIVVMDVFNYFKYAVKKNLLFDIVILDPPSFARSKKHTFSAAKDYTKLLKEAIAITNKNGMIVASTNCSTFGMDKFKGFIDQAFYEMEGSYELLEEFTLPSDFHTINQYPEGNYLKVVFIKKK